MKKLLILFLANFIFYSNLFSQNNETLNIQIQASLKRGISVISQSTTLDFGEIVLSNSSLTITKSPQEGLRFKVLSHPEKPVMISFNSTQLTIQNQNNQQQGTITFVPKIVHTGINSDYIDPVEITSGVFYQPQNSSGEGVLNLWVGGSLILNENELHGDYSGTLTITIAY